MAQTKRRTAERTETTVTFDAGALKLKDAARYLSVSVPTIHRLVERGMLRPNRAIRHLLFPISELRRFLEEGMVE